MVRVHFSDGLSGVWTMKHSHYYKTLPCLTVDVYRVLHAFEVTDPCLQHAAKKIMCAGGRGAKDAKKDVEEAIDSLVRWLEMRREESGENLQGNDLKVSVCDTMNLADSFLKDIRATELAYAENQHKTLWTEADEERAGIIALNGNEGDHYREAMNWKQIGEEIIQGMRARGVLAARRQALRHEVQA